MARRICHDMELLVYLEENDSGEEMAMSEAEEGGELGLPGHDLDLGLLDGSMQSSTPPRPTADEDEQTVDGPPDAATPTSDADEPTAVDDTSESGDIPATPPVTPSVVEPENADVPRSRKRKRDPKSWKSNIRKRQREAGKEYTDRYGKKKTPRGIKGSCREKCRFKCPQHITYDERCIIHKHFWQLSDDKKNHFYDKCVDRNQTTRVRTLSNESRRSFSFVYNFQVNEKNIRVCKEFFLKTLDISQRRVEYFFNKNSNAETGVPRSPLKGKSTKSYIAEERKQKVRDHINSFPRVESRYCRANTTRQFLESTLSISEMYRLYSESVPDPLKKSMYSTIFNNEFNISFHHLKKDRCDHCEEAKAQCNTMTDQLKQFHETHIQNKVACKVERDNDRLLYGKGAQNKTAVISFDLENVFSLPRAEVSNFFYKRKLSCYNLTAHCSISKKAYNALWHECISGRSGNHIASALVSILGLVVADHPEIEKLILWSDACVPQNRNSIMSLALKKFLSTMKEEGKNLKEIEQKFSEPGHGNIQEVDNVHSRIEKWLSSREIYSPPALLRALTQLGRNGNMQFLQMHERNFLNYQAVSSHVNFNQVPYTKVKHLCYSSEDISTLKYRNNFNSPLTTVRLWKSKSVRVAQKRPSDQLMEQIPNIVAIGTKPTLNDDKKKDIKSMYRYMSDVDKAFYNTLM